MPARDKQTNLFGSFVNYTEKKFYNIGTWMSTHKTTYEVLMFILKESVLYQESRHNS